MKATTELRTLDQKALNEKLVELKKEHFALRMQKSSSDLKKTHLLRQVKKDIARVMTYLTEKNQEAGE